MNVLIVGCGKAGRAVVESMAQDNHNVTAIDNDMGVIRDIANTYDVMALCGSATSRELLLEAGVAHADLFVSITASDEVNMLACFLAKRLGAKYTVARIRQSDYNEDGLDFLRRQLELSVALNPELLTAEAIFDALRLPAAVVVDTFAGKTIQILEFIVREGSELVGKSLAELRKKSPVPFVACAVARGESVVAPRGELVFSAGDKAAFMVARTDAYRFLKNIGMTAKQGRSVMVLGASETSYYLCKMLASSGYGVKLIEKNPERCAEMADKLPHGVDMILGDGADQELLREEGINSVDAFVAMTGKDEENILISCYAQSQRVPKVVSKVSHSELNSLAEKLGLDCIVSPRKIVANALTRYARALSSSDESKVETMYSLLDGKAEALEFEVLSDCSIADIPLQELKIKNNYVVAGIIRGKETFMPTGGDCIIAGDRVVIIAVGEHLYDIADMIR